MVSKRRNTIGSSFPYPNSSNISPYCDYLEDAGLSRSSVKGIRGPTQHFLIWLDLDSV